MLLGESCGKVISGLKMGASGNGNLDHHECKVVNFSCILSTISLLYVRTKLRNCEAKLSRGIMFHIAVSICQHIC